MNYAERSWVKPNTAGTTELHGLTFDEVMAKNGALYDHEASVYDSDTGNGILRWRYWINVGEPGREGPAGEEELFAVFKNGHVSRTGRRPV